MIETALVTALLITAPVQDSLGDFYRQELTDPERDRIVQEIKFAYHKMYFHMKRARLEASMITDVDIQEATVGAIKGGIAGLAAKNAYGVVIGAVLGVLAEIAGDSYRHFEVARVNVKLAETYGLIADELQDRLWNDE